MMAITQPAVSHHLKILREAGLVSFKKEGLQSFYHVTLEAPLKSLEDAIHQVRLTEHISALNYRRPHPR